MDTQLTARRTTPADLELATEIITLAFAEDPLWSWALARPDGRIDHHGAFWRVFLEGALRYRSSSITEGGAATSVWSGLLGASVFTWRNSTPSAANMPSACPSNARPMAWR